MRAWAGYITFGTDLAEVALVLIHLAKLPPLVDLKFVREWTLATLPSAFLWLTTIRKAPIRAGKSPAGFRLGWHPFCNP